MKASRGFTFPVVLLLLASVSVVSAGALALSAYHLRSAAAARTRSRACAAAEGAIWLGIGLVTADLTADSLADGNGPLAGPLPSSFGECPMEYPPEFVHWIPASRARQVLSPLLPPGADLWLAYSPPGLALLAARARRGESDGGTWRIGHLEYLETDPLSFALLLARPAPRTIPRLSVHGRIAVFPPEGIAAGFTRLDCDPPVTGATPLVGWDPQDAVRELVVAGGAVVVDEGSPPPGRIVAAGDGLPSDPFRFPEGTRLPERVFVMRKDLPWPAPPIPGLPPAAGEPSIVEALRRMGAVFSPPGPPPWEFESAGGTLSWDEHGITVAGTVLIEGDVDFPAGINYSGTGVLGCTGRMTAHGSISPTGPYPTECAILLAPAGGMTLLPEGCRRGVISAVIATPVLELRGGWSLYGPLVAGRIEGPADAELFVSSPPRGLLPAFGGPFAPDPRWVLLAGGCQDPGVRWPTAQEE